MQKPRGSWLGRGECGRQGVVVGGKVGDEVPRGAGETPGARAAVAAHTGLRGPVPASS